jgi:Family of unknown function (DUF6677)
MRRASREGEGARKGSEGSVKAAVAVVLGWLVPGAGHLYLGKRGRALVLGACLLSMFVLGVAMHARLEGSGGFDDPLALLRSGAQMAVGLPYFLARALGYEAGIITAVTHEYGNTFTEVSGLLNILVMLDAYDIAVGRKP